MVGPIRRSLISLPAIALVVLAAGAALTAGCAREAPVLRLWIAPEAPPVTPPSDTAARYVAAVRAIATIMSRELEMPLAEPFPIFVYATRAAYAEGLVSAGGITAERAEEIAAYSIAVTQLGQLHINNEGMRELPRSAWLAVIAHELAHRAQYQLSGGRRGRSEQWLREGMADWVACQVLDRLGETTFRRERERALREIGLEWSELRRKPLDLAELGRARGWEARHLQPDGHLVYRLAFLLTDELIQQHGWRRLLDYFRVFAEADDRFDAFQQAFGGSLKEFETDALKRLGHELVGRES